jgi:hypothetical protein
VADTAIKAKPKQLVTFADLATNGTQLSGIGFVLDADEAMKWIQQDKRYEDVLFPYVNGKELNDTFNLTPRRYCISFGDSSEVECERYPLAIHRVRTLVKPNRDKLTGQIHETCYWKHWDKRPTLYEALRPLARVLVCSLVSKHLPFVFLPTGWIYSKELAVFPTDKAEHFAILQSTFHEAWVRLLSSTMKSDLSYSISDGFRTFPSPHASMSTLRTLGESYHGTRSELMLSHKEGLTKSYNRFHDPEETAADIQKLRALHVEMDKAVAAAYGWDDLDLGHDFHQTKQGERFTISETARREVLGRLLKLNHERHAEEVAKGLHEKKGKGKKPGGGRKRKNSDKSEGASLYGEDAEEPDPAEDATAEVDDAAAGRRRRDQNSDEAAERPTSIDGLDTNDVMAAFRQAARGRGWLDREELLKLVSVVLGYQRLGPKIEETLRGHLRAAIRRKIIEADGMMVRPGAATMDQYGLEELRDALCSNMRKGTRYEREDVIHAVASYLGFARLTDTSRDALKSAINSAIRQGILGYEGSVIWREQ